MWFCTKSKSKEEKSYYQTYEERFNSLLKARLPTIKLEALEWTNSERKLYVFAKLWSYDGGMTISYSKTPDQSNIPGTYIGYCLNGKFYESEIRGFPGLTDEYNKWREEVEAAKEKMLEKYPEILQLYKDGLIKFNF